VDILKLKVKGAGKIGCLYSCWTLRGLFKDRQQERDGNGTFGKTQFS